MAAKVCLVTTVHHATDTRIYKREAMTLIRAGYQVTLVAPEQEDARQLEGLNHIPIPRASSRLVRMLRSVVGIGRRLGAMGADVYHIHDPELLYVGNRLAAAGRHVIYDAHEDLPAQILGKPWIPGLLRRPISWIAGRLEKKLSRRFSAIVAATPAIASRFPGATVVHNFPDLGAFPESKAPEQPTQAVSVFYVGGITHSRGAEVMVRAMSLLQERKDAVLHLIGGIEPASLDEELRGLPGSDKTRFLGRKPWETAWRQVADSNGVGLLLYQPRPNHIEALPTKLFEYMAAAVPVVVSDFPLWRRIVSEHECGIAVDPTSPGAIAEAIDILTSSEETRRRMGRNGRRAVEELYNWKRESRTLLDVYERILS